MKKTAVISLVIVVVAVLAIGAYFCYGYFSQLQNQIACTQEAKICPDGSAVGRAGPKCEFAPCPEAIVYKNQEYGFQLTLPNSWQGYSVEKTSWQGWEVNTGLQKYFGVKLIIKNPKTTPQQAWQDIPIMIFTPNIWQLVSDGNVSVSAAPIGPQKIGQNSKYIFANPPRWYGFTDAIGWEEAVEIVKTFTGLNNF